MNFSSAPKLVELGIFIFLSTLLLCAVAGISNVLLYEPILLSISLVSFIAKVIAKEKSSGFGASNLPMTRLSSTPRRLRVIFVILNLVPEEAPNHILS